METARRNEKQKGLRFKEPFVPTLAEQIADELVRLRTRYDLTQAEFARRVETTQSAISRAESGLRMPSTRFLDKVARVFKTKLVIKFVLAEQPQEEWVQPAKSVKIISFQERVTCPAPPRTPWRQPQRLIPEAQSLSREARIA